MEILIFKDYQELSSAAGCFIQKRIKQNPKLVLGLATGGTVLGLYQELVHLEKETSPFFKQVKIFNLDEYLGLADSNKNSFACFLNKNFLDKISANKKNIFLLNGKTKDYLRECSSYEQKIQQAGGIDLQILGIGVNGHLAFNEPGSSFDSTCRLVQLSSQTIESNSRFFKSKKEVPKNALSLGLKNIFGAKEIILLASGKEKAKAVKALVKGKITENFPCSLLQKHPKTTLFLDQAAAFCLRID